MHQVQRRTQPASGRAAKAAQCQWKMRRVRRARPPRERTPVDSLPATPDLLSGKESGTAIEQNLWKLERSVLSALRRVPEQDVKAWLLGEQGSEAYEPLARFELARREALAELTEAQSAESANPAGGHRLAAEHLVRLRVEAKGLDKASLLASGVRHGHEALCEEVAAITRCAERAFSPENERSELALGVIVGRLDSFAIDKGPERCGMGPGCRHTNPRRGRDRHRRRARARPALAGARVPSRRRSALG
jgi:hypothetical protein